MNNNLEEFSKFSKGIFNYLVDILVGSGNKSRVENATVIFVIAIILLLVVILMYVGVEVVKLLMRNNFGANGMHLKRAILSLITFLFLATQNAFKNQCEWH